MTGGIDLGVLKNYSNRCNSNYKKLESLADRLYDDGLDTIVDYLNGRVKPEHYTPLVKQHEQIKASFSKNNQIIAESSKELKKNFDAFESQLKKGNQDTELLNNVLRYTQTIVQTSQENAGLITEAIQKFYAPLVKQTGQDPDYISNLAKNYIDILVGVFIPNEMKQEPVAA